jgi:hypothetical protein
LALPALSVPLSALRAADVKLEGNAKITLEFPDLPETFFAQSTGQKLPAALTAQLPENYTREGHFPVFVFLDGGNGGRGTGGTARRIVGARDFITVNSPLFKDQAPQRVPATKGLDFQALGLLPSQIILPSDGPKLSRAYRVMLQKLFDTVPNTAVERSALGGFSNGAHATAALLAEKDAMLLRHFRGFCFVEGGLALGLNPAVLTDPDLKHCRLIALFGDHDADAKLQFARTLLAEPVLALLTDLAHKQHVEFTRITMTGYGHQFPPQYVKLLGCWIRGEKLPAVQ